MHGIFALLVLLAVGAQYVDCACTDAAAALAELATCLEGRIADMESMSVNKDDVCQTATTINTHLSVCSPLAADCPDEDKQTGMQHLADAEQNVANICEIHKKNKMCEIEITKCVLPLTLAISQHNVDFGKFVEGAYNATEQAEICTNFEDLSSDEMTNCLKEAREKDVCKSMPGWGNDDGNDGTMGSQPGPPSFDVFLDYYTNFFSVCNEECKDLKTKMGMFEKCMNSSSFLYDMTYLYQKAVVLNQTTGLENQCNSVTNHVKACYADFECCPIPIGRMQITLQVYVPKTTCPEMQNALEEQCPKDADITTVSTTETTTVKTISSTETSKASQMTTSMLVLSGTLALWAFLRA